MYGNYISGYALSLDAGKTYKYSYETTVSFNELNPKRDTKSGKDVGHRLKAEVEVTPVFKTGHVQLVKLQVYTIVSIVRKFVCSLYESTLLSY